MQSARCDMPDGDDASGALRDSGNATIARYVEALRSSDVGRQYRALTELRKLSSASTPNKDAIREHGAIAPTVELLKSSDEREVQSAALYLLRSLSVNAANQIAIADAGAVEPLLHCLESQDESLYLNAAATVWNLAANAHNKVKIGAAGGVQRLLLLLANSRNDAVHNEVCGALRNLSYAPENVAHFVNCTDGVLVLIDLLWSPIENVRKNSAIVLNMCSNDTMLRQLIADEHCAMQLKRVLHQFQIEPSAGCALLLSSRPYVDGATMRQPRVSAVQNTAPRRSQQTQAAALCTSTSPHAITQTLQSLNQEVFGSIAWSGLQLECKIGKGAFSDVYRARYKGFPVAVKLLREKLPSAEHKRNRLLQEYRMLAALRHPNVVLLMGTSLSPQGKPVFVSELCARGSLKTVLPQTRSILRRLQFGQDIVHGLNWLHAHNIVHRDLKCDNVLVDEQYCAKISDLGLALIYFDGVQCPTFKGNLKYSAPEILAARVDKHTVRYPYCPQTDTYAFALILWELVTRQPLFEGINGKDEIVRFVCAGQRPALVPGWPLSLQNLLSAAWHDNASKRPSMMSVQRDYPSIMVDVMCPDPTARKVCRALWAGMETRKVPYDEFVESFEAQTSISLANASLCYHRCLQTMLCDAYDHCVTFERVCNLVHTFGPMDDVLAFVNEIVTLFEQPWFFGYVRGGDAKQMLLEQWKIDPSQGYYMFRFSESLPGSFSIFTIDRNGVTSHRRVGHQYSSDYFVTIGDQEHVFRDLYALHDHCLRDAQVCAGKAVLPGAPYQCFFVSNPLRNDASAGESSRSRRQRNRNSNV